mgnify:CR=1 FL=1
MTHWALIIFAMSFSMNSWSSEIKPGGVLPNGTGPNITALDNAARNQTTVIQVGAEQLKAYLPLLKGKRVGLVANQTSVAFRVDDFLIIDVDEAESAQNGQGNQVTNIHLLDLLLAHKVNVTHVFAPEHGVRGDHSDGEIVKSSVDTKTGIPLVSIYGKNKRPPAKIVEQLDVIVYDIQDVGARFYTYINSMFYMMQAAQEQGIPFIVLDRPNPHLQKVDGPMLDPEFRSFVGLLPVPMVYGLTVGELAKMIVGENWLNTIQPLTNNTMPKPLALTVVPVNHYQRTSSYDLPIPPSPNLPNAKAVELYPSLVLFEATTVSIGRGTSLPFQLIGHPKVFIGDFTFTPRSIAGVSKYPKWENTQLTGTNLSLVSDTKTDPTSSKAGSTNSKISFSDLHQWNLLFKLKADKNKGLKQPHTFIDRPAFFDKLAGTSSFRKALLDGESMEAIRKDWAPGLNQFLIDRQPYLIYR